MMRLLRMLAVTAAIAVAGIAASCAFMHDPYPPAGGQCTTTDDCFLGEKCTDAGACVPGPQSDAAAQTDGGAHAD